MEYTGERNSKGQRHGQGTATHPNGSTYTGKWWDNKPDGQGTYTAADGSTYTGTWWDGKPAP